MMDWLQISEAVLLIGLVLVFLFTPHVNYHLSRRTSLGAEGFLCTLESMELHRGNGRILERQP
jgi:hypothetical protein